MDALLERASGTVAYHPGKDPLTMTPREIAMHIHAAVIQGNGGEIPPSKRRKRAEKGKDKPAETFPGDVNFAWLMAIPDESLVVALVHALDPVQIVPDFINQPDPDPYDRMEAIMTKVILLSETFDSLQRTNRRLYAFTMDPTLRNVLYRRWYQRPARFAGQPRETSMMSDDRVLAIGVPATELTESGEFIKSRKWYEDLLSAAVLADYLRWLYRAATLAITYFAVHPAKTKYMIQINTYETIKAREVYTGYSQNPTPTEKQKLHMALYERRALAPGVLGYVDMLARRPHLVLEPARTSVPQWDIRYPLDIYSATHSTDLVVPAYYQELLRATNRGDVIRVPQFIVRNFPNLEIPSWAFTSSPWITIRGNDKLPFLLIDNPLPLQAQEPEEGGYPHRFLPTPMVKRSRTNLHLVKLRVPEKGQFERWVSRFFASARLSPAEDETSALLLHDVMHREGDKDVWNPKAPEGTLTWKTNPREQSAHDETLVLLLESRDPKRGKTWQMLGGTVPKDRATFQAIRSERYIMDKPPEGWKLFMGGNLLVVRSMWELTPREVEAEAERQEERRERLRRRRGLRTRGW